MNTIQRKLFCTAAITVLLGTGGCAGMSEQDRNTAYGAGAGGVAGAIITGGSPLGTAAGAAAGGVLGHILTDDDEK